MDLPASACSSLTLLGVAGGLWVQAAFMGQYRWGGGCSMHTWSQVLVPGTAAELPVVLPRLRQRCCFTAAPT